MEFLGTVQQLIHKVRIIPAVEPCAVFLLFIVVRRQHQTQVKAENVLIGILCLRRFDVDIFRERSVFRDGVHHFLDTVPEFRGTLKPQRIDGVVGDLIILIDHNDHIIIVLRPGTGNEFIAVIQHLLIVQKFGTYGDRVQVQAHGTHNIPHADLIHQRTRVHLERAPVIPDSVDVDIRVVCVLNFRTQFGNFIAVLFQPGFKVLQIVGADILHHRGDDIRHKAVGMNQAVIRIFAVASSHTQHRIHHRAHIHRCLRDGDGIGGQRLLLHIVDIALHAVGQGQNQRDADNADGSGKGREDRASLLGHQVVEGQAQGRKEGHGRLLHPLLRLFRKGLRIRVTGHGIGYNLTVQQPDDPGGVLFRQVRVVRDHNDQPVLRHLFQNLHDLHGGLRVQRACRFIRQENIRVVDQGPGNGHPLHLTAGHLVGHLLHLVSQPHLFQGRFCPLPPLGLGDAGQRQCQFHVGQHILMGNQVVALEYKAHRMIPVGIPVPVMILFCGFAVDNQVTGGIVVKTADDIQKGRLAAAGLAQNRYKFTLPKRNVNPLQSPDLLRSGVIVLCDLFQFKHILAPFSKKICRTAGPTFRTS